MLAVLDETDKALSRYIHFLELNKNHEKYVYIFARLMNPDVICCIVMMIYVFTYFNKRLSLIAVFHVVVCLIFTLALKKLFGRPRPETKKDVERLYNLRGAENNHSMPSGDSLQAANFSVIFHCYFGIKLFFLFIPFVMFARIYYFCHFIGDTIIGVLMGLMISSSLYKIISLVNI